VIKTNASAISCPDSTLALKRVLGAGSLICFSHLRWNFVFQRPQHLMARFAETLPVHFWEEPMLEAGAQPRLDIRLCPETAVTIITPVLPHDIAPEPALRILLDDYLTSIDAKQLVRWYYTPMMLPFSEHIDASASVYDCMDELANFRFAPPELMALEQRLMDMADVVFTGGYSLYEAKQDRHANIHPFPSSVDRTHFGQARSLVPTLPEYATMPKPRFGFYGVIDERMDLDLLANLADQRPEWQVVILGPVVKISEDELPRRPNLHYLGGRNYSDLPAHLASWDVALMPFAINDSTRFISPTKTPEYLAGGRPVVSTPITDVVRHYGDLDSVFIADRDGFVAACDKALALSRSGASWLTQTDARLSGLSWESTSDEMLALVGECVVRTSTSAARIAGRRSASPRKPAIQITKPYDYLIVGAGFAGSVLAERLATQLNKRVLLIDRRPHIGGNAYDFKNAAGVLMHQYGPHIFHTNSAEVFDYLARFTTWRPYEHRVRAVVDGKRVPMPINRTTLNQLYDANLASDEAAAAFLAARAEPVEKIKTSRDVVVNAIGTDLYEKFFQGYTRKQWGMDPSELDKSVTARVPTRTSTDDRYFQDKYQYMPADGYTRMFEQMLDHPLITIQLGVAFEDVREQVAYDNLIYTGPIDAFFDYRFGKLPYRSLRFRHLTLDREQFQEVGTINFPDEATPWTRISEYKHITGQKTPRTTITYEYPAAEGDPYYPVPRPENQALYKKYEALALAQSEVTFCGRLATYRYYNMDQVVGQALATFRRIAERERQVGTIKPAEVHERSRELR